MTLLPEAVGRLLKMRDGMNGIRTNHHSLLLVASLRKFFDGEAALWPNRLLDSHVVTSWSLIRSKQLLSPGLFIRRIISYTCTCRWLTCITHQKTCAFERPWCVNAALNIDWLKLWRSRRSVHWMLMIPNIFELFKLGYKKERHSWNTTAIRQRGPPYRATVVRRKENGLQIMAFGDCQGRS